MIVKLVTSLAISAALLMGTSFGNLGAANATSDTTNTTGQTTQSKIKSVNNPSGCYFMFGIFRCV